MLKAASHAKMHVVSFGLNLLMKIIFLSLYQSTVRRLKVKLDVARNKYEKATLDEMAEMTALEAKKRDAQLRQYLDTKLIRTAKIKGIGKKADTLLAYGVESALDITLALHFPGIPKGGANHRALLEWRIKCEASFRYNPNTPLPQAEVQAIKLKYAQLRQSAFIELRGGAGTLSTWESNTRQFVANLESKIPQLIRVYAQAMADHAECF